MLKPAMDFGRQLLSLMNDVKQSKADITSVQQDIKDLREEVRDLADAVKLLTFHMQRNHDNDRHEREKLVLRFENMLLRTRLGLPPPDESEEQEVG